MLRKLLQTKKILFLAILLAGINTWGQTDDFTDGNFTANPAWSGNTGNYAVITTTPFPNGDAATDGSYLASNASVGNAALVTASTETAEWRFSLGTPDFNPSAGNAYGVILMSNTALSGNITTATWTGYFLRIGVDSVTDRIELWKKTGSGNATKVGEWANGGSYMTGAMTDGVNLRITKSGGTFTLYYSAGFTYASTPTTNAGTVVDGSSVISTSSYFGIWQSFSSTSASRRVYIDNITLGSGPTVTLAGTLNEATLNTATFTATLTGDTYEPTLTASKFVLNNAPSGVTVSGVTRTSATVATVTLAYSGTDFDASVSTFNVTINGDQLVTSTANVTSGNLTITAVNETIAPSPTSISGLTYFEGTGPSTASSFTVSSSTLQPGPGTITVSVPAASNFEVSTTSATTNFGTSATLSYTGTGTFAGNTVWVRLKQDLTGGLYSDNITLTGGKITATNVSVSGSVTAPAPANDLCGDAVELTVGAAAINGTLVGSTLTAFNNATGKDVWYKFTPACTGTHTITVTGFSGNVDMVLFSGSTCPTDNNARVGISSTSTSTETIAYAVTAGTTYILRIYAVNATAENSTFTVRVAATPTAPTVTAGTANTITFQGATIPATATVTGCSGAVTVYGIEYSTTSGFGNGAGTSVAGSNLSGTNFSVSLTGLNPATTYYYKAYATNATNTGYSTQGSFTTSALVLEAPEAGEGEDVTSTSFTAVWEPVENAQSYRLDVSTTATFETNTPMTDLIISEYVEGSSSEKYIEIYNGTGAAVNLSNYRIRLYANGTTNPTNDNILSGTLANGATIVYRNSSASLYQGTSTTNTAMNFTGNDAIALYKISTTSNVDIFGRIGENVSWSSGAHSATNRTLVRKSTVTGGVTTNPGSGFPTLATEWDVFDEDDVSHLGSHTYNGTQEDYLTGYKNRTVNGLSEVVTGLTSNTTYYYRVRAYGHGVTSANSDVIDVTTRGVKTWQNGVWSGNGAAPVITDEVIIAGDYDTDPEDGEDVFSAATLTLNSGTLTVAAGTTITVDGMIDRNGGSMLVQSNANVIQNDDDAVNSGSITIERETPSLKRLDYKLWSSPVAGQVMSTFSPATESTRFYQYNNFSNNYTGIASSSTFDGGTGYLIRMPNALPNNGATAGYNSGANAVKWKGSFTGVPNNGPVDVPVTYYEAGTVNNVALQARGYNAIGNPYMSTISAGRFYEENQDKIAGTFYFWRKTNENPVQGQTATPAYVTYTPGVGGTGNGADAIQVGQGFIVNVNPTAGFVTFNNSMRVANNSDVSYRQPGAPQVTEKHRYWINLVNTTGTHSQALVGYVSNATNGIDNGIDGKLLNDNTCLLYTIVAETDLAIQGRPLPFNSSDVVALGYKATVAGNYKIALDHFDGLFAEGQHIYLKDKAANVIHDLNAGQYTFASGVGTFANRFEIVYTTDGALGTDSPVATQESVIVYKNGNALQIAAGAAEIASVAVYDLRGRMLYSNDSVNASETSVTTLQAAQQVLVVQVTTSAGSKVSKKVVY